MENMDFDSYRTEMNSSFDSSGGLTDNRKYIEPGKWYNEFDENGEFKAAGYDISYYKLLGFRSRELEIKEFGDWLERIHPDDRQRVTAYAGYVCEKHPEGLDYDIEYRMMTKWGYHRFHDFGHISRREDGSVIRCDGVLFDIQDAVEVEKKRKELITRMTNMESAFIIFVDTDRISVINKTGYNGDIYLYDKSYSDSILKYIEKNVFEKDKKEITEALKLQNLVDNLKKSEEYTVRYRDISTGKLLWYEIRAVRLSDTEILFGFSDKNNEIIGKMLYNKMRETYFGLYYINPEADYAQIIKTGHPDITGKAGQTVSYTSLIKNIAAASTGEAVTILNNLCDTEYLKRAFAFDDTNYYTYKSIVFEGNRWVNLTGLVLSRDPNGAPAEFALGFSLLDDEACKRKEAQEELKRSMGVIGGMASEYTALYHVDLDTDDYISYHLMDKTKDIMPYYETNPKFADLACSFADSDFVHPDDREKLHQFYPSAEDIKEQLKDKKRLSLIFKRNYDGQYLWTEVAIIKCEKEDEEAHNIIVGFVEKDDEIRCRTEYIIKNEEANKALANIASKYNLAYRVNMADDSFTLLRMDDNIVGKGEEFKNFTEAKQFFINCPLHPADKSKIEAALDYTTIRQRLKYTKSYSIEYRAVINNTTIWHEMIITQIVNDDIAIGFALKDLEITNRRIEKKHYDEYIALFVVDMDTEMIKPLKDSALFNIESDGEAVPYEAALKKLASSYEGEAKEFFLGVSDIENVRRSFKFDDKRSFSYKSTILGTNKWIETTARVIDRHKDGSPSMFTFSFIVVDALASSEKELQEQIMRTSRKLEAEVHHNTVLNQIIKAGPWMFRFNKNNEVTDAEFSDECIAVLQNDITDGMQWFGLIHPEDSERVQNSFFSCLTDPSGLTPFDSEYRVHTRNDEYRWIHSAGRMKWNEDGTGEFYGICIDIEDTIQSREEQKKHLQDALSMAEASNRSKTAFLNNVSHDIRTPMNAIIGFTGLAKKHLDNEKQTRDYLEKIDKASAHLLSLINDVLEMSRIESGKMNLNEKPEKLPDIVHTLSDIIQADIEAKQHSFFIDMEGVKNENIICDKLRLNQVMLNILSNSIKYTKKGGEISMRITEKAAKSSGYASYEFKIKDNGIGMDKEYLKTIFDPFTRAASSTVSGIQGTGLGMAITKNLIDMMGGDIVVQSEPGHGTEMTINIDFKICSDDENETALKQAQKLKEKDFSGKKILLAEDNELNREIASELLTKCGFILDIANDGSIAVNRIKNAKTGDYDLILMDVQMPILNGYKATRQIRELGTEISKIPIIAMTANAYDEDRILALEAGMNDHIAKPIDIEKLKETLAKYI